jgi:hypothetical protein
MGALEETLRARTSTCALPETFERVDREKLSLDGELAVRKSASVLVEDR